MIILDLVGNPWELDLKDGVLKVDELGTERIIKLKPAPNELEKLKKVFS